MKKYELLEDDTITINGGNIKLYRIKACIQLKLRDKTVNKGDLGGYIQCEDNLSHDGNAWIYDNAKVYSSAQVFGDASVYDEAKVYGKAQVHGNAKVFGNAEVYGRSHIHGDAKVCETSVVIDEDIYNS